MTNSVDTLYNDYRTCLKPLVAEFESHNEQIMPSCLVNLALMFDRVALCETAEDGKEQQEHLDAAFKHLNLAINDTREGVMAGYIETIGQFQKTYGQDVIEAIKDGSFIGPFNALNKDAHEAMESDQVKACDKLEAMVGMINEAQASALVVSLSKDSKQTTRLKWAITVLVSLIVLLLTTWLL